MKHLAKIFLGAALVAAPFAHATTMITGTVGFGGNGTYDGTTFTPGGPTPATGTNAYVNAAGTGDLSAFTFLNPAIFSTFSTSMIGSGEQVFTSTEGGKTLTFLLTSISQIKIGAPGDGLVGAGILSETGFTNTAATFTLNTDAGAKTFVSFNTAAAAAATPEPSSLVLLGSGLVSAAGMLLRRRRTV